ncbi:MAG: hypothetical protein K0M67_16390 [Thiobacillus sp.]|nr:hypothetical protein [Thiobacillus sp.]
MSTTNPTRPKLAALVYRASSVKCRQYAFPDADTLQTWAARHPYRNETLRVHAVGPDGKMLPVAVMPATEAADYVRQSGGAA